MDYRIEHDSMGDVKVPADRYWAAQTERSRGNFRIGAGIETMPREITSAFGILKKAAAIANYALVPAKMTKAKLSVTFCTDNRTVSSTTVSDEIAKAVEAFPLGSKELKDIVIYGF